MGGSCGRGRSGRRILKVPVLPTALFVSCALNLFLVGVIAGGWREMRARPGPPPPPPGVLEPAPGRDDLDPAVEESGPSLPRPAPSSPPRSQGPVSGPGRPAGPVLPVRETSRWQAPPPGFAASGPDPSRADPPSPGDRPSRPPPGGSPLMRAARDLPERERVALQALLRAESEAVRVDLQQSRRERAATWRALARGEVSEAEAARRLDTARRQELAARSRVEDAVADWALRQSPEVRSRLGEALAEDALPDRRRPVRPPGRPEYPPTGAPGRAEGS